MAYKKMPLKKRLQEFWSSVKNDWSDTIITFRAIRDEMLRRMGL